VGDWKNTIVMNGRTRIVYEYVYETPNRISILYHNRISGNWRRYVLELHDGIIHAEDLEEALELSKYLYKIVSERASIPNLPVYALLITLSRRIKGLAFNCKSRKKLCPLRIYRFDRNGVRRELSVSSMIEQMYRISRKYGLAIVLRAGHRPVVTSPVV